MTIVVAVCLPALSQTANHPSPISLAEQELDRTRQLVDAGTLPRKALEEAQRKVAGARDQALIDTLLYGKLGIEELDPAQADALVGAARRQMDRGKERLAEAQRLVDAGVAARPSVTPFVEDSDRLRRTFDEAVSRANLLKELMEMARREVEAEDRPAEPPLPAGPLPLAEKFVGAGHFDNGHWRMVVLSYEAEFGRSLPVSARGDTAFHRAMGFDHRGRVDVALDPDSKEGVWLRSYLESMRVPYFAFRAALRGAATAPHIHIGPPSLRQRRADVN